MSIVGILLLWALVLLVMYGDGGSAAFGAVLLCVGLALIASSAINSIIN